MKHTFKSVLVLFMLTSIVFAQGKYTEFKVGLLGPKDAATGFFGGLTFGRSVDQNLGIALEIDVYKKSYDKEEKIDTTGLDIPHLPTTDVMQTFEQNAWLFPIFFQFQYLGEITPVFHMKVTAGLGYEFLYTSYNDYENKREDSFFFHGFAWHIDAGVSYPLSRASDFFGEILYHGGTPSKDKKDRNGFPMRTEVDMSGLGFRVGLRVYNFGF
ncbi:MAG: hypothetical protein JW956_00865 [Calditrichaceae bacterium]|nr:hypothetical protein [Calditrichaceae bacterium]